MHCRAWGQKLYHLREHLTNSIVLLLIASVPFLSCAVVGVQLDIQTRLAARRRADPAEFVATLELQERRHREAGYKPERPISDLRSGTYYLCEVDSLYRRTYARKS